MWIRAQAQSVRPRLLILFGQIRTAKTVGWIFKLSSPSPSPRLAVALLSPWIWEILSTDGSIGWMRPSQLPNKEVVKWNEERILENIFTITKIFLKISREKTLIFIKFMFFIQWQINLWLIKFMNGVHLFAVSIQGPTSKRKDIKRNWD